MLYFDYTATTPVDKDVLETYIKVQNNYYANINSLHRLGQTSNALYVQATEEIKALLNIQHNIVYTGSASEANNLAIQGIVKKYESGRIITTKIEHPSVFETHQALEKQGYDVIYLPVNEKGLINIEDLIQAMNKETILVSIMWVNNIVGSIQNVKEIIEVVKKYPKAKLHIDAVQGFGKLEPNFKLSDIDLLTASIHKIYGPKGIGLLFVRETLELEKVLYGTQTIRPGTTDLALVVSACKAIKKAYPNIRNHYDYVKGLWNKLYRSVTQMKNIHINSYESSPYIFNISFLKINAETVVHYLEKYEIYVSTGSACSSKLKKPEKTIMAMTNNKLLATNAVRISLSHLVTEADLNQLIKVLGELNNVWFNISALWRNDA